MPLQSLLRLLPQQQQTPQLLPHLLLQQFPLLLQRQHRNPLRRRCLQRPWLHLPLLMGRSRKLPWPLRLLRHQRG